MKQLWIDLRNVTLGLGLVVVVLVGVTVDLTAALGIVIIELMIVLVCAVMIWRNEAEERTDQRHREVIRALGGIYRAVNRDD